MMVLVVGIVVALGSGEISSIIMSVVDAVVLPGCYYCCLLVTAVGDKVDWDGDG